MPRKRKAYSVLIDEMGVRVRLYERTPGGLLQREVRWNGRKDRISLGHRDRMLAEEQVRVFARTLALRAHAGQLGPLPLGVLCQLYREHRGPLLSPARQRTSRIHEQFVRQHLGDDFQVDNLSQTHIDGFVRSRQTGQLTGAHPGGKAKPVRLGTIRQNLNWLAAVLRWARGHRVNGRPLLALNPLEGIKLPHEKNVRRPVASIDRYTKTLTKADQVDPTGRLACMLALARYTGRRVNAICQLRRSDVLLQREDVVAALALAGQDEALATHTPHGALRWRAEHDKIGYEDVSPISGAARTALETYLRRYPCLGEAPLFPSRQRPDQPLPKVDALYLLRRAEQEANVPKLERGVWHPYRRLWASERKHLPDVDVARGGGWRDLTTMKRSYQQADPATTLRVVENSPESSGTGHTLDTQPTDTATLQ